MFPPRCFQYLAFFSWTVSASGRNEFSLFHVQLLLSAALIVYLLVYLSLSVCWLVFIFAMKGKEGNPFHRVSAACTCTRERKIGVSIGKMRKHVLVASSYLVMIFVTIRRRLQALVYIDIDVYNVYMYICISYHGVAKDFSQW